MNPNSCDWRGYAATCHVQHHTFKQLSWLEPKPTLKLVDPGIGTKDIHQFTKSQRGLKLRLIHLQGFITPLNARTLEWNLNLAQSLFLLFGGFKDQLRVADSDFINILLGQFLRVIQRSMHIFNRRWRVPPAPAASGCQIFVARLAGVKGNRIQHEHYSRVW